MHAIKHRFKQVIQASSKISWHELRDVFMRATLTFRATMIKFDIKSKFTISEVAYGSNVHPIFWFIDLGGLEWNSQCSYCTMMSPELSLEGCEKSCAI